MAKEKRAPRLALRRHPHLYQINAWAWLDELAARHGRPVDLGRVPDAEWDALRARGFDLVWLMGVWRRSAGARQQARCAVAAFEGYDRALPGWTLDDVVGSPYAVADYQPEPRLGGWRELDRARHELNRRGMGLVLDLVPNHTALDHPWVGAHPDYFIQGDLAEYRQHPDAYFLVEGDGRARLVAHGRDPYFAPWADSAQLNHFNPAARAALLELVRGLARHCDGLRCDMAMLLLNDIFPRTWSHRLAGWRAPATEFWPDAIAAAPGLIWIAEVYWGLEARLQQLGFDFTYDKDLLDLLRRQSASEIRRHLQSGGGDPARAVRFLENHDEDRSASAFAPDKLPAALLLGSTLPGLRFFQHGQLTGSRRKLPIQLARAAAEEPDPELVARYAQLLGLIDQPIFHDGDWRLLEARSAGDPSYQQLVAYRWSAGDEVRIVVVNWGDAAAHGLLAFDGAVGIGAVTLVDLLTGAKLDKAEAQLRLDLAPWQSLVLRPVR
ncbi:MAG: alpha-amylase [Deltaproteobacteria bacterium]|nr:alpha-amylase [Deltaproteobacteria bacterium]